jgi:hypothetical protein
VIETSRTLRASSRCLVGLASRWNREDLDLIAAGLRRDAVAMF